MTQIEEIKQKVDIVSVVREYVPSLKRSGRNYFGLCPFHSEKTPSFSVNEELGVFKCFGCGESGDVISFVQKLEGIDFPKALQIMADRAGVVLQKVETEQSKKRREEKDRILEANKLAAQFYSYLLFKHKSGTEALKYTQNRKIRKQELEKFLIGFAPDGYENLKPFLLKKGFTPQELVKWGLLVEKNGKVYDKFRNRLMFPIFSSLGDVVGFSGRDLGDGLGPKYLNSPETLVYKKSELLYGLFQAKEAIRKSGFVILVEGNVDILTAHGVGQGNIVAPLGTALTEDQVKLLKRYCDTIYFAFDSDTAGEKALLRGFEIATGVGFNCKAINLDKFQDVDDLITHGGNLETSVKGATPVIKHILQRVKPRYDLATIEGSVAYMRFMLPLIAQLYDPIERDLYLRELGDISNVRSERLYSELAKLQKKSDNVKSTNSELPEAMPKNNETYLISALIQYYKWIDKLNSTWINYATNNKFYLEIIEKLFSGTKPEDITKHLPEQKKSEFNELQLIVVENFTESDFVHSLTHLALRLADEVLQKKIRTIKDDIELQKIIKLRGTLQKQLRLS